MTLDTGNSWSLASKFQSERERLETLLVLTFAKVFYVTLTLENRSNGRTHFRMLRCAGIFVRRTGIADCGEEIADCVVNCHSILLVGFLCIWLSGQCDKLTKKI